MAAWFDNATRFAAGVALVAGVVFLAGQSQAEPAPDTSDKPAAKAETKSGEQSKAEDAVVPGEASKVRQSMEKGVTEINTVLTKARKQGDASRIACVLDKRQRADRVMELATGELIVLEGAAQPQEKSFAMQKLNAASGKLEELVVQARQCAGDAGPRSLNVTENQLEREDLVPHNDPTSVPPGNPGVPPPLDPGRPIVSSAVH